LIEGNRTAAAQQRARRDSDWRSEAFLLVEFTNVLASSIATKRMTLSLAQDLLAKLATYSMETRTHPSYVGLGNGRASSDQRL